MARTNGEGRLKKRHGCVTCLIINLVVLAIFIAAIFIGGSILFKSYVSPQIGGVTLSEALSLMGKLMRGKEAKIAYTEEDLDEFYSDLSSSLFLADKDAATLQYELVDDNAKRSLAEGSVSAAEEEGESGASSSSYDKSAAWRAFQDLTDAERFDLLSTELKTKFGNSVTTFANIDQPAQENLRKELGLKLYPISVERIMTELFPSGESKSEESGDTSSDALENFLLSLDFDFENILGAENFLQSKYESITVSANGAAAFINDIVSFLVGNENSPLRDSLKDLPAGVKLTEYVKVASVKIAIKPYKVGDEYFYLRNDVALGVTLNLKLRDMVNALLSSDEMQQNLAGVPDFAKSIIPSLIPKNFSVSSTLYPFDTEGRQTAEVTFNGATEKQSKTLSRILGALIGDPNKEDGTTETADGYVDFFMEVNKIVVQTIQGIESGEIEDENGNTEPSGTPQIRFDFVETKDGENYVTDSAGNHVAELKIMTFDTLLGMLNQQLGLSKNDPNALTTDDVFTVLKCLYVHKESEKGAISQDTTALSAELQNKYGLSLDALTAALSGNTDELLSAFDIANMAFDKTTDVSDMDLHISAENFVALLLTFVGEMDKGGASESVSAAEEEGMGDILETLAALDLQICEAKISQMPGEENVFYFEFSLKVDIAAFIKKSVMGDAENSDDITTILIDKVLPSKATFLGLRVCFSQAETDGVITHKVGTAITDVESDKAKYKTKFKINTDNYADTDAVFGSVSKFLNAFDSISNDSSDEQGGDVAKASIFDQVSTSLEEVFAEAFASIDGLASEQDFPLSLNFYAASGSDKGGIRLPSMFQIMSDLVNKTTGATGEDALTADKAKTVLAILYKSGIDFDTLTPNYTAADAQNFIKEINKNYYLSYDSKLDAETLFSGESFSNLNADSVYFKPSDAEEAKWKADALYGEEYEKAALYTDKTPTSELSLSLTGKRLAAILAQGDFLGSGMMGDMGTLELTDVDFAKKDGKLYMVVDMKWSMSGASSEEDDVMAKLLPSAIKLSAEVVLYDPLTPTDYATTISVNNENGADIFALLGSLVNGKAEESESVSSIEAGEELSFYDSMMKTVSEAVSGVFSALDEKHLVTYLNGEDLLKSGDDACIRFADIFTVLINTLEIKDATASDLADKLREFGRMPAYTLEGDSASWSVDVTGVTEFFTSANLDAFLDEVKSNYYWTGELTAENLMGDSASFDVSTDSVSFPALYADTRTIEELKVKLDAKALGALVKQALGNIAMGEDASASLIQSKFRFDTTSGDAKDHKAYLDLALLVTLADASSVLPTHIVVQTEIDLGYDFVKNCFPEDFTCSATVKINNMTDGQTETLFGYISGFVDSVTSSTITDTIATSIHDGIKNILDLYPSAIVLSSSDKALVLPDVYSFLIEKTGMEGTTSQQLADRLRGFGMQYNQDADPDNTGNYDWVSDLKLFESTDDQYVYTNMKRAYFIKDSVDIDMTTIYTGLGDLFAKIDDTHFNLNGDGGLYHYSGDIKTLKISDKALGVMIQTKSNESFASAVSGKDMTVSIESVRIYIDDTDKKMRIESGIKVSFTGDTYPMLPKYFFVKALTKEKGDGYETEVSINNLSHADTVAFFASFSSLESIGVTTDAFNLSTLETEINKAIGDALKSFTDVGITYGVFTAADIENEYNETNYPDDNITVAAGDGYLEVPSVYTFMNDLLFEDDDPTKPEEEDLRDMFTSLFMEEDTIAESLHIKDNAPDEETYSIQTDPSSDKYYFAENATKTWVIASYSDKALSKEISKNIKDTTIYEGKITVPSLSQLIILHAGDTSDEYKHWIGENGLFGEMDTERDYIVVTIYTSLSEFSAAAGTGGANLYPDNVWFTVLIDFDDADNSKGLINCMSKTEMDTFTNILKACGNTFDIDDIAIALAEQIVTNIKSFTSGVTDSLNSYISPFTVTSDFAFFAKGDTYYYSESDNKLGSYDAGSRIDLKENENNTGVGYLVIYATLKLG